jgi:ammonia channel protein AmtB
VRDNKKPAQNRVALLDDAAVVTPLTLPGLALFYGGLVRAENVLSVLIHCFAIACLVSVLWLLGAYSLAFNGDGPWSGDLNKALLLGVSRGAVAPGTSIPETVFFMFQMTFAIITPALMVGAFVERMRFSAVLICARGPLGLGWRLAPSQGNTGFCRRSCCASDGRVISSGSCHCTWPPHWFSK